MPRPVPVPIREVIWRRWQAGHTAPQIAEELSLAPRTVRHLLQRFRRHGEAAIRPDSRRPPAAAEAAGQASLEAALALRRQHPRWGAPLIRSLLLRQHPADAVFSVRSLPRWFRRSELARPPRSELPTPLRQRALWPHDVWQRDASEQIRLATGVEVSWLRIVDEDTGGFLLTRVFPSGRWMNVPATETVATLRVAFARWGMPVRIRGDNGYPWGSTGDLPTELGLWLLGLGIELVDNPPRRPQHNGVVERSQDTGQRWADPEQCSSVAELQRSLEAMDTHQREFFAEPSRSRLRLFPALAHSGRASAPAAEANLWQESRLWQKLAEYAVVRQINARGLISVYGRNHSVGRRYAGQEAYVRFDAETGEWLFELVSGPVIGRQPAGLSLEAILGRRVTRRHRGKTPVASSGET